jgi:hypothetical protein
MLKKVYKDCEYWFKMEHNQVAMEGLKLEVENTFI